MTKARRHMLSHSLCLWVRSESTHLLPCHFIDLSRCNSAAKCFVAMIALFMIKNRLAKTDEDCSEPPYDEDISHFAERGESVAQQSALEIAIIPQTPISDVSASQGSSLIVSPYTNDQSSSSSSLSQAHYTTPNSLIGLGIKHPSRNYQEGSLSRRTLGFSSADHQEWTPYDIYADVPSPCIGMGV